MEDVFSVSTVNRFSVFGDVEDDPGDAPFSPTNSSAQETPNDLKKEKQLKSKPKEKQQVTKVPPKQQDNGTKKAEEKPRPSNNRSGKFEERSSFASAGASSSNRGKPPVTKKFQDRGRQNSEEPEDSEGRPSTSGSRRGTRRGGGVPRGGGGQGVGRGGKREFDRRSGNDKTSVKPFEKRGGEGAHNWGTVQDDLKASSSEQSDWPTDETADKKGGESPKDVSEQNEGEGGEKVESKEVNGDAQQEDESAKEMTLDEYKALKEKTRAKTDFKERRPGEDEDSAQWKNTVPLKKDTSSLYAGTREIIEKPKTSGRKVEVLQPNFYYKDPTRNERGGTRGGRGRDRDGRGPDRERSDGYRGDKERGDGYRGDKDRGERGDRDRSDRGRGGDSYRGDRGRGGDSYRGDRGRGGDRDRGDRGRGGDRDRGDRGRGGDSYRGDRGRGGDSYRGDRGRGGDRDRGDRGRGGDRDRGDRGRGGDRDRGDRDRGDRGGRSKGGERREPRLPDVANESDFPALTVGVAN